MVRGLARRPRLRLGTARGAPRRAGRRERTCRVDPRARRRATSAWCAAGRGPTTPRSCASRGATSTSRPRTRCSSASAARATSRRAAARPRRAPRAATRPAPTKADYALVPPGAFEMGCVEGDRDCQADEKPRRRVELTKGAWLAPHRGDGRGVLRVRRGHGPPHDGRVRRLEPRLRRPHACRAGRARAGAVPASSSSRRTPSSTSAGTTRARTASGRARGCRPRPSGSARRARRAAAARFPWGDAPVPLVDGARRRTWPTSRSSACTPRVRAIAGLRRRPRLHRARRRRSPRARLGVFDLAGNVAEWCSDSYDPKYYETPFDRDPPGPPFGLERMIRGGSWLDEGASLRASYRVRDSPALPRRARRLPLRPRRRFAPGSESLRPAVSGRSNIP